MRKKVDTVLSGGFEKPHVYKLTKKRPKPALKGRYYPSIKVVPSEDSIFDPETKRTRTIRYAVGEPSIFKDEQPKKVVLGTIVFTNGSLRVERTNPELKQYLDLCNWNADNPNRKKGKAKMFAILDNERDAGKQIDEELDQSRAIVMVGNMDFDDLRAYARVLGVDINRGAKEIRHDMMQLAKADPKGFVEGVDDPLVKRHQMMLDAKEYGIIDSDNRGVYWKVGNKRNLIVPVPVGKQPIEWFAEWTMNDKDGDKVFKEISKKVDKTE